MPDNIPNNDVENYEDKDTNTKDESEPNEKLIEEHSKIEREQLKTSRAKLLLAIRENDIENIKKIVNENNWQVKRNLNSNIQSALHIAVEINNFAIVKILAEEGPLTSSEKDLLINDRDYELRTPLHEAIYHGHDEIAEYLIKQGAKLTASTLNSKTPLTIKLSPNAKNNVCLNLINKIKKHLHKLDGNEFILKWISKNKSIFGVPMNEDMDKLLHIIVYTKNVKLLRDFETLTARYDVNELLELTNKMELNALHYAAFLEDKMILNQLLSFTSKEYDLPERINFYQNQAFPKIFNKKAIKHLWNTNPEMVYQIIDFIKTNPHLIHDLKMFKQLINIKSITDPKPSKFSSPKIIRNLSPKLFRNKSYPELIKIVNNVEELISYFPCFNIEKLNSELIYCIEKNKLNLLNGVIAFFGKDTLPADLKSNIEEAFYNLLNHYDQLFEMHPNIKEELINLISLDNSSPFTSLHPIQVAAEILMYILHPEFIDQGNRNLCGPASFMTGVADKCPELFCNMYLHFYRTATLENIKSTAFSKCNQIYSNLVDAIITHIAYVSNQFGYQPDSYFEVIQGQTRPMRLSQLLEKYGYEDIKEAFLVTNSKNEPLSPLQNRLIGTYYSSNHHQFKNTESNLYSLIEELKHNKSVICLISMALYYKYSKNKIHSETEQSQDELTIFKIINIKPMHYVYVTSIQEKDKNISFTFYTYGKRFTFEVPTEDFLKNYHGFISASPPPKPFLGNIIEMK